MVVFEIRLVGIAEHIVSGYAQNRGAQPQPSRRNRRRGDVSAAHEHIIAHAHVHIRRRQLIQFNDQILKWIAEADHIKLFFVHEGASSCDQGFRPRYLKS